MNTSVTHLMMEKIIIFFIISAFIWLIVLSYYLYQTIVHYRKLVEGVKKENLADILDNILAKLKENKVSIEGINGKLQVLSKEGIYHVQKIGILRFNPFADTGGNQSFVLSILDGNDNGIVLTSLHSRSTTRWYAKNVRDGKGVDHQLSEEEQQTIKQAGFFNNQKKSEKSDIDKVRIKS